PSGASSAHADTRPDADFNQQIKPFFEQYCVKCHGEDKQKGDLRVDTLARDFVNAGVAGHWTDIMDRINAGEMPPKKETQARPKADEIAKVAEWISQQLTEAEAARQ